MFHQSLQMAFAPGVKGNVTVKRTLYCLSIADRYKLLVGNISLIFLSVN